MGFKHRLMKKRAFEENDFALQITSLADILIIVLIFLLKSFSNGIADTEQFNVNSKIALPQVKSGSGAKDGLKIEISEEKVDLEGEEITKLRAYRFQASDLNSDLSDNGSSRALHAAFARQIKVGDPNRRTVWIIADQRAPYATIQTVIASAALSGYSDFKLAVTKED